ncbi:MAG: M1 family metallopeptidase [Balneolaceae bacterium]
MSKRPLLALLLLSLVFYACTSPKPLTDAIIASPQDQTLSLERPIPNPIELPASFLEAVNNKTRTLTGLPGEEYWTQYADYKLNAELSPSDTTLYGSAAITYYNNSPYQLPVILFELSQNLHTEQALRADVSEITGGMQINSVTVNGQSLASTQMPQQGVAAYGVQGTTMFVVLDQPVNPGKDAQFEIEYQFKIPQEGASGRMGYSDDNVFYIGYWYPHIAVFDDVEGWFTDDFTGNAEFYFDFADYEVNVIAPKDWVIMGTGEFLNPEETLAPHILERYNLALEADSVLTIISESDFGKATISTKSDKLEWKFRAENVRDVAFSATTESIWDGTRALVGDLDDDGILDYARINAFWRPSAINWNKSAEYAQHVIEYLSDFTSISYPWPHMTTVEGEGIIGGGMEYPMITLIGSYNNLPDVALYDVTAHELAHMWLPMIVNSNERRHAWMDEGSTTFHEANARWDYFNMEENLLQEFAPFLQLSGTEYEGEVMRRSDYHYSGMAYGVASYPKPASLLFTLRGLLGEDVFMDAWTEYINRWAYKHPTPYDLFNTFEDVSGQNLGWFWRSWYFETWNLDQAIKTVTVENNSVTIVVEDLGNVPMPVDLTVSFADGTEIDKRISVDHWLTGKRTLTITLPITDKVTGVTIDKAGIFPDVNRENNFWK